LLDGHFRPQSDNLLLPFSKPNFIGNLEDIQTIERFLREKGIQLREEKRHATAASERLNHYYDRRSIDLVREKYATDFSLFGYSGELSDSDRCTNPGTVKCESGGDLVMRWIATGEAPAGAVEIWRTNAIFQPGTDLDETLGRIGTALATENHLWEESLSMMTMSPGFKVGTRHCSR
jgi:hypothetical protein